MDTGGTVNSVLSKKHSLTVQALFDDEKNLQAHLDGLQQMIVRRGGVPSLPPSIQLTLTWYAPVIDELFNITSQADIQISKVHLYPSWSFCASFLQKLFSNSVPNHG